jgi:hypothetical protein
MAAQGRRLAAEARNARDLALLSGYYAARLAMVDFRKAGLETFEKFRAGFDAPRVLSREEVWARLDAMAARGLVTTTYGED